MVWGSTQLNSYTSSTSVLIANENTLLIDDPQVSNEILFTETFYIDTLGWDTQIWDFAEIDISSMIFPTIK